MAADERSEVLETDRVTVWPGSTALVAALDSLHDDGPRAVRPLAACNRAVPGMAGRTMCL